MQDEQMFTPHAGLGWLSWDEWSTAQDVCHFAATLQRVLQPPWVIETGVGVGRLTSHLDLDGCEHMGFESNPKWRQPPAQPDAATPSAEQMATAQLVILDSDPSYRLQEIRLWAAVGARGSVCLVHDAGNGHSEDTIHYQIGAVCAATGQPGVLLRNPRGGWLGVHT